MLPLLLLFACTPKLAVDDDTGAVTSTGVIDSTDTSTDDSGGDTACVSYRDQDGDGWGDADQVSDDCDASGTVDRAGDCDDQNAAVHPDAVEVCNTFDDDCDNSIDEGDVAPATWYQDLDGDGFGTSTATAESCDPPDGFAANDDDCNDADDTVHPYADETCDERDQDCDHAIDEQAVDAATWYADLDSDGFGDAAATTAACDAPADHVDDARDCDDTQSTVHPGADETCDEFDQDCDGSVDEDPVDADTWYIDSDGDGYGDPLLGSVSCKSTSGTVADDTDCDDGATSVHPGATETCDDVDQDCDGTVDEDATDPSLWYADSDADGFGDAGHTTYDCDEPAGYTSSSTDCDDSDDSVFPGAEETCDEDDEDCDGTVDEDPTDPDTWYADADGDGHGDSGTTTRACDAPTHYVASSDDCDDTDPGVNPSASESCDGTDQDCDKLIDEGVETTWFLDSDSDGYGDPSTGSEACSAPSPRYVSNDGDCYDSNGDAYPGQSDFFDGDRGDGSFDYDCDGSEELEYPDFSECEEDSSSTDFECDGEDGWYPYYGYADIPDCGEEWYFETDCGEEDFFGYDYCDMGSYSELAQTCR